MSSCLHIPRTHSCVAAAHGYPDDMPAALHRDADFLLGFVITERLQSVEY
jgi:hypothetical protein